jgi:uncharacterized protein (DUF2267 family)
MHAGRLTTDENGSARLVNAALVATAERTPAQQRSTFVAQLPAVTAAFIVDDVERAIGDPAINVQDRSAGTCRHGRAG